MLPQSPHPELEATVKDASLSLAKPDYHHHFRSVHHMYRASHHQRWDPPPHQTCSGATSTLGRRHHQIHRSKIGAKLISWQNFSPKYSKALDLGPT